MQLLLHFQTPPPPPLHHCSGRYILTPPPLSQWLLLRFHHCRGCYIITPLLLQRLLLRLHRVLRAQGAGDARGVPPRGGGRRQLSQPGQAGAQVAHGGEHSVHIISNFVNLFGLVLFLMH